MTTPTGTISLLDVANELCNPGGTTSLGGSETRALAGKSSGAISLSDCKGKTNITSSGGSAVNPNGSTTLPATVTSISPITSYNWSITSVSGSGTASISSGKNSATCLVLISSNPGAIATVATVRCDVVSRGISRATATTVSYRNTSTS